MSDLREDVEKIVMAALFQQDHFACTKDINLTAHIPVEPDSRVVTRDIPQGED